MHAGMNVRILIHSKCILIDIVSIQVIALFLLLSCNIKLLQGLKSKVKVLPMPNRIP